MAKADFYKEAIEAIIAKLLKKDELTRKPTMNEGNAQQTKILVSVRLGYDICNDSTNAVVLATSGDDVERVLEGSSDMDESHIDLPSRITGGLWVWQGDVSYSNDPDEDDFDINNESWRRATAAEAAMFANGLNPFEQSSVINEDKESVVSVSKEDEPPVVNAKKEDWTFV